MNEPRICIIGAGALSTRRIYPYIGAAGGQLVGVCDLDPKRAAQNARRFGGKVYSEFEAMLGEQKPDGVMVCIGPEAHAKLATRILELGYPVYTEKPPAASALAALEVARTAKRTGRVCMTAFKKRYTLASKKAKSFLERFPRSEWLSLSIDYCSGGYGNTSSRDDFLLDFGVHIIDLTSYLFGDVKSVFAFAKDKDAYAVALSFASGAVGNLNLNDGRSFAIPTEEVEITVKGGNFMTLHNSSSWRVTENGKPAEWREPPTFTSAGDSGYDTGHLAEIEAFFACLRDGHQPVSSIYESYKSLLLYEAIRDSAASGKMLEVRYEPL